MFVCLYVSMCASVLNSSLSMKIFHTNPFPQGLYLHGLVLQPLDNKHLNHFLYIYLIWQLLNLGLLRPKSPCMVLPRLILNNVGWSSVKRAPEFLSLQFVSPPWSYCLLFSLLNPNFTFFFQNSFRGTTYNTVPSESLLSIQILL